MEVVIFGCGLISILALIKSIEWIMEFLLIVMITCLVIVIGLTILECWRDGDDRKNKRDNSDNAGDSVNV